MNQKDITCSVLTILLIILLILTFKIQPCKASGTIYIRANGTVDPATAPISSTDNITYSFTSNIYDSIIVERDNVTVNGCGYTLQGTRVPYSIGIDLSGRNNATVTNLRIEEFGIAVELWRSHNNRILGNYVTDNVFYGIDMWNSTNIIITENDIAGNQIGVKIEVSSFNTVTANNIADNKFGVHLFESSGNFIYSNNFVGNEAQVFLEFAGPNFWDDGYPSGGNYWSDFNGLYPNVTDEFSGPTQNQLGSDGFWDSPYVIDENNKDNYPIVPEFPKSEFFLFLFMILTILIVIRKVKTRMLNPSKNLSHPLSDSSSVH